MFLSDVRYVVLYGKSVFSFVIKFFMPNIQFGIVFLYNNIMSYHMDTILRASTQRDHTNIFEFIFIRRSMRYENCRWTLA